MQSTLPQSNQRRHRRGIGSLVISLVLIGLSIAVWVNRQYIADSVSFWQYEPPAAVASVAERSSLTDEGKFAFYAAQPSIDGNRTFDAKCDRKEQSTAILGCYVGNRIYIFDVTDNRLDGIKEVTAVHEMLHAVYQRLSESEKRTIDRLVEEEYKKLQDNPDFAERIAFYARTEPGERDNELHSIIGTEVAEISDELERHYGKYLSDRSKIIEFHNNYVATFATLKSQTEALEKQMDELGEQRKAAVAKYNADAKQLKADIATFNSRAENGSFTSQEQFNTQRAALVQRTTALEGQRSTIDTMTKTYNELVEEYNDTVSRSNELYKSIDSSLAPAPKV